MHPYITTIDDLWPVDDGACFVIGEVSEGITLEQSMRDGSPLNEQEIVTYFTMLLLAVE